MEMIKRKIAVVVMSTLMSTAAFADSGSNVDSETKPQAESAAVSQLSSAATLAKLGLAQEDALLLITAAKIQKGVAVTDKPSQKTSEGGEASKKDGSKRLSTDQLLERATELAGNNSTLLALISDVRDEKSRGRKGGAVRGHEDAVEAHSTDTYSIAFKGGRTAEVYITGDGDTDLDLYIYDENDNLICSDSDGTDEMLCRWNPRWTGSFTVKIKNLGSIYNEYALYTN